MIVPAEKKTRPVDAVLVKAIAKAWFWFEEVRTGKGTLAEIARREGTSSGAISQRIGLAFLDPKIVEMILAGQQPVELSVTSLAQRRELPIAWSEQRQVFC